MRVKRKSIIHFTSFLMILLGTHFLIQSCQSVKGLGNIVSGDESAALNVMSFNIRYGTADDGNNSWKYRDHTVVQVLEDYDPDIVGLQEALHFQIEQIMDSLPEYAMVGVGRDDGETEGEFSAILYKKEVFEVLAHNTFWFSDTPQVIASTDWGNSITRICTWGHFQYRDNGEKFYLYNAHLDHRSQNSREMSAVLLSEKIQDRETDDPVIVTGDLNAGERNPAILYLKGKADLVKDQTYQNPFPMVDSYRVKHPDATRVGTFNGFEGETGGEKIDYVFIQPTLEVLKADIIDDSYQGRYPSDHFPVYAVVKIAQNEAEGPDKNRSFRKY